MSYCKKLYFTNKVFGLSNVPKLKKKNLLTKKNHLNIARKQELVIDHHNQQ